MNSREMVREVGPGWEFYLDRLQQSLETGEQATIEWDGYMDLAPEYAQEFGLA